MSQAHLTKGGALKKPRQSTDGFGYKQIHTVVESENINELTKLIDQGCDLDIAVSLGSKRGFTALHMATELRNCRIIKILLQNGADFTLENKHRETPLHTACRKKIDDAIEMFFKAFCTACSKINGDIEKAFAEKGLPIHYNIKFSKDFLTKFRPLHFAIKFQLTEIILILINCGVDLQLRDASGMMALHCLVNELSMFRGTDSSETKALARVVHKFAENETGFSRTIYIIDRIIRLFMSKCRDAKNLLDDHGRTPLYYLYECQQLRCVLLARLTSCSVKCNRLITDSVRVNIIEQLLRIPAISAHLPAGDHKGNTILHLVAKTGPRSANNWEIRTIIRRYLAEGGDINATNHAGYAPLHLSVYRYNASTAEVLLRYGADVNAKTLHGSTAYSILRRTQAYDSACSVLVYSYMRRMYVLGARPSRGRYEASSHSSGDGRGYSDDECRAELERMRAEKIDAYTALYDLLHKEPRDLLYHASNEKLTDKEFLRAFPIYGFLVKSKINQAKNRAALFGPSRQSLQSIIKRDLPDACLHAILRHLNIIDLKILIDAKVTKED